MGKPSGRSGAAWLSTLRSTLLLFLVIFPTVFMVLVFHEGGHALADMGLGYKITLFYVHPFILSGYVRSLSGPAISIWQHIAGPVAGLLLSLVLFVIFWRRRSIATLPLVLAFPWAALMNITDLLGLATRNGDYYNLTQLTGWPTWPFFIWCGLIVLTGIFFFVSLFPLFGLGMKDKKTLIVIPLGLLLWCGVSILVGHLCVPGSTAEVKFHLNIAHSADTAPVIGLIIGLLLAAVYLTLYRWIEPKLPKSLRTPKVDLTWRSLLIPGILCAISVVIGLVIVCV